MFGTILKVGRLRLGRGIKPSKSLLDRCSCRFHVKMHIGPCRLWAYMTQRFANGGRSYAGFCEIRTERTSHVMECRVFCYLCRFKNGSPWLFGIYDVTR